MVKTHVVWRRPPDRAETPDRRSHGLETFGQFCVEVRDLNTSGI